jgi:hypothetical protein
MVSISSSFLYWIMTIIEYNKGIMFFIIELRLSIVLLDVSQKYNRNALYSLFIILCNDLSYHNLFQFVQQLPYKNYNSISI